MAKAPTPPPEPQPFQSRLIPPPKFGRDEATRTLARRATERYMIEAQAQVMSPGDVDLLNQWMKWSPGIDPQVVLPMMLAQIAPDSETGRSVTEAAIATAIEDGTYANGIGFKGDGLGNQIPQAEAPVRKPDDHTVPPEDSWIATVADNLVPDNLALSNPLEPITLGSRSLLTTLVSGWDTLQGGTRSAAGDTAKVQFLTEKHGLSPDLQQIALNIDAAAPDDKSIDEAWDQDVLGQTTPADLSPEDQAKVRSFLRDYRTPGTFRVGGEATGDMRARMLAGQSVGGQAFEQSPLGQTSVEEIVSDTGSWLPPTRAEIASERAAIRAYDMRNVDEVIRGVEPLGWTPGRGMAHVWWDADETAFNVVSGAVDAGMNLTMDPANLIPLGAAAKVVKPVARVVAPGSKAALADAIEGGGMIAVRSDVKAAGVVPKGRAGAKNVGEALGPDAKYVADPVFSTRNVDVLEGGRVVSKKTGKAAPTSQFVVKERAWTWLMSGKGQRVVEDLASRDNAYDIWKRSGGPSGGMTWELAETLARTGTAHETRAILASRIGMEIDDAGQLTKFGRSPMVVKFTDSALVSGKPAKAAKRALATAARGKLISFQDDDTMIRELDAFGTAAKIDYDEMAQATVKVLGAKGSAERYAALYGPDGFFTSSVKNALIREGVHEDDARQIVAAYDGALDQSQREMWNKGIAFGGGPTTGSPTLMSEGLGDAVLMPSYREILRGASGMRGLRQKVAGKDFDAAAADFLQDLTGKWRSLVLVRPAYTLREVGEMGFAMALSGYDSFFTHPIQMIAMAVHVAGNYTTGTAAGNLMKAVATGTGDEAVRMALRREANNATTRRLEGEVLPGLTRRTIAAGKRGAYEAAVGAGKVKNAARDTLDYITFTRGRQALAPWLDVNQARITGKPMWQEFNDYVEDGDVRRLSSIADTMSATHGNYVQDEVLRVQGKDLEQVRRPDIDASSAQRYSKGIADRLRAGANDPDIRNIASGKPVEEVLEDYRKFRKDDKQTMFANSKGMEDWVARSDDEYIAAQGDVLIRLTGGDPELLDAVATGKFNDLPIGADNAAFVKKVQEVVEKNPDDFPEMVGVMKRSKETSARFDQLATDFFNNTATFSDVFARGPLVRQAYAQRIIELAEYLSPAAKADAVAKLRKAGDVYLAKRVQGVKAKGGLTIEEADSIAAGFATREAQRVFYDASRRQNWALALRVVSPFAQATMNTFKRWGLMSLQNPQMYYRSMKPLMALQDPGSAVLYDVMGGMTGDPSIEKFYEPGKPSLSANGFFYTDRYGERKFAYPLVGPLAKLMGAPVGMVSESSMENLNVGGTTMNPGFGPMIALGATFFTGDTISEDTFAGDAMRAMFPYGLPPGDANPLAKVVGTVFPTAYRKAYDASFDSPARANTSIAVMAALANSGQYDLGSNADVTRLQNDAEQIASRLMYWSAIGGSITPSTFAPDVLVEVTDPKQQAGITRWMMADRIAEEFQKYTEEDYKTGALNFVGDYGATALFAALPRTKMNGIAQATNDMWAFRTDNKDSYERNIEVIGLFMSSDDMDSNFARELFMEQRNTGVRRYLTPDEYTEKVNDEIGWILWNQATADIDRAAGDDDDKVANLRARVRQDLISKYPGFSPSAKDTGKTTELIEKVKDALDDPAIQSLPSAYYVDRYLRQRDAAISALLDADKTDNLKAKGNSDIAQALTDLGNQYANEDATGGFRNMWNRLLSQELYQAPPEEVKTP